MNLNHQRLLYLAYDIAGLTPVFGRLTELFQGTRGVQTAGASTTITATVNGVGTFSWARAGDFIWFSLLGVLTRRKVQSVVSPDEITVDAAIDLTGGCAAWSYRQYDEGTGADNGAVPVHFLDPESLAVKVDINAVGGLTNNIIVTIQARAREDVSAWFTVRTETYAVAGGATSLVFPVVDADNRPFPASSVRVGLHADVGAGGGASDIDVAVIGVAA